MFIAAQIVGAIGSIVNIISIQLKSKKNILMCFIIANLAFGVNFILLKSYTGAYICFIAAVQTYINSLYDKKNKLLPKWLMSLFILVSVGIGSLAYNGPIDLMPIACSILYVLTIVQKKEKNIRGLTFLNIILWIIFDIFVGAYTAVISDVVFIASTIIAIFRHDILHRKQNEI